MAGGGVSVQRWAVDCISRGQSSEVQLSRAGTGLPSAPRCAWKIGSVVTTEGPWDGQVLKFQPFLRLKYPPAPPPSPPDGNRWVFSQNSKGKMTQSHKDKKGTQGSLGKKISLPPTNLHTCPTSNELPVSTDTCAFTFTRMMNAIHCLAPYFHFHFKQYTFETVHIST